MQQSPSLDASEAIGAAGATHPRVTLDSMKNRIAGINFLNAGEACTALGAPSSSAVALLTICILTLDNGWTLLGKSAPASAENFDAQKGRDFAYEDALRQLWPLEGYLLREALHLTGSGIAPAMGMKRYVGTKIVNAMPFTRKEWCDKRGWTLPQDEDGADEGYLVEYADATGQTPNVDGFRGYVSWSPKDVFERSYR